MYKKGTIVLVPFPFTDLSGSKVRPALIISEGAIGADIVVVFITSQIKTKEKHLISIQPDEQNSLKIQSQIVCGKIATLDKKIVLGELGHLSEFAVNSVNTELRKVLGL
jgi:mRNA interferase MazF